VMAYFEMSSYEHYVQLLISVELQPWITRRDPLSIVAFLESLPAEQTGIMPICYETGSTRTGEGLRSREGVVRFVSRRKGRYERLEEGLKEFILPAVRRAEAGGL
jgi:hypothetical protein